MIDKGFVLRANSEVTDYLNEALSQDADFYTYIRFIPIRPNDRLYGLELKRNDEIELFYCSLCDIPTAIEAMKSIDLNTYFKSCDVSQIMFVHNESVKESDPEWEKIIEDPITNVTFDPLTDEEFVDNLYNRGSYGPDNRKYEFRHGLTPATQNIKNQRWRKEQKFDRDSVIKVQTKIKEIITSLIDSGFAGNVDEKLYTFDHEGKLKSKQEAPKNSEKPEVEDEGTAGSNTFKIPLDRNEDEEMMDAQIDIPQDDEDEEVAPITISMGTIQEEDEEQSNAMSFSIPMDTPAPVQTPSTPQIPTPSVDEIDLSELNIPREGGTYKDYYQQYKVMEKRLSGMASSDAKYKKTKKMKRYLKKMYRQLKAAEPPAP